MQINLNSRPKNLIQAIAHGQLDEEILDEVVGGIEHIRHSGKSSERDDRRSNRQHRRTDKRDLS